MRLLKSKCQSMTINTTFVNPDVDEFPSRFLLQSYLLAHMRELNVNRLDKSGKRSV